MNDDGDLLSELLRSAQPMGFLPTNEFWWQGEECARLRWPIRAVKLATLVAVLLILRRPEPWSTRVIELAAVTVLVVPVYGLFQRLLRWQIRP